MNTQPKILVVDDDEGLLKLLSIRLKSEGFQTCAVTSGKAAIAQLDIFQPDLIVTDLRMDGMDGIELFHEINQTNPLLPVIILTAHGTIPDAVGAIQQGVYEFMTKPFVGEDLVNKIREGIENSRGHGESAELGAVPEWRREIITRSQTMEELLEQVVLIADSDATILIQSESGTGKELLARAIHKASHRHADPFSAINCSAIPENLLESELFGHVKGAFTDASDNHKGLLQAADGGTLFLDEVGEMPLGFQAKLLRALEEREVRPVGSTRTLPFNVRIIAATNRDLERAVENGEFREDLYYRLKVIALELPPLRERREDIPLLANAFLKEFAEANNRKARRFSAEAIDILVGADFPGNIRQLRNVVQHAVALSSSHVIPDSLIRRAIKNDSDGLPSLAQARERFERNYLIRVLKIANGNVTHAAKLARRNRTEFYKLLGRYELDPRSFRNAS